MRLLVIVNIRKREPPAAYRPALFMIFVAESFTFTT